MSRQSNGYLDYPLEAMAVLPIISGAQQAGFSLEEIRQVLPEDMSSWKHDELLAALNRKVADIAALEARLAQNKAQLLSLIQLIDARPEEVDCQENAARVMHSMGMTGKGASFHCGKARSTALGRTATDATATPLAEAAVWATGTISESST